MKLHQLAAGLWVALLLSILGTALFFTFRPHPRLIDSVVFVQVGEGHGSGVYIGNGEVITAAHVAKEATAGHAIVVFRKSEYDAQVVWYDSYTDTALLHIQSVVGMGAADLACREPDAQVGDPVTAIGNPLFLHNVETWGRISGHTNYNLGNADAPKVTALVADLTIAPGNSGGPAFSQGRVIGITNAMASDTDGMQVSLFPITLIIPSSVICHQLSIKHPTPKFDN